MNRFDLQKMAEERIADAAALLDAKRFQAAYYLCGYAVECALKASSRSRFANSTSRTGRLSTTATFTTWRNCSTSRALCRSTMMRRVGATFLQKTGRQ